MLWNSDPQMWTDMEEDVLEFERSGRVEGNWSCGSRKHIPRGSRIFLKRTRHALRGIVASGYTTGPVREDKHWDRDLRRQGKRALYVPIEFDAIVEPLSDKILPQSALSKGILGKVNWDKRGGGEALPDEVVDALDIVWAEHLSRIGSRAPFPSPSGARQQRSISIIRRKARDSRFSRWVRETNGHRCAVCPEGISYADVNILEAAHIRSVEEDGPDDLHNGLPLCPNHHALFDEGLWSLRPNGRVLISPALTRELALTLTQHLNLKWAPDAEQVRWHQKQVFRK
jgi:hypothetical protein